MAYQFDEQTREALIADLKEILKESGDLVEKIVVIHITYPSVLGDLRPMLDSMSGFQQEVKRSINEVSGR